MSESKLDAATASRLAAGEILIDTATVAGSAVPEVHVRAMIAAPLDRVWPIIDRVARFQHTMAGVKRSEELSRGPAADGGERVRARITVGMPFPLRDLTSVTEALHTVTPGQRCERAWRLVEGDYRVNGGRWTLYPFGDDPQRTLAVYVLHAEPSIPVPGVLKTLATTRAIPRLIAGLRRAASDTGG